ncbi:PAAR-like domain-containing protein [Vibrio aquimaris]|uniref:Toxin VasX N-terminal region domain-containing protein n=1 Tax=Vibrio aquimaris TaxID=2587862 RepID=A0A5P9CHE6_9VIBR|nr:PAAR-like domain-containing protein [Vibrio aquimaris]QFT25665.1 hypothetical protein FIV01_04415 [Vibrio aquimaris]
MPVTINANGLSIVHKGSGGEANATSPDVCLTTVGPAVVPIPYGNNAKSADLVDGTTTVSADGGNSIAIKGSKFAKSTGDADGDQKGISSGTIEDEAEFISASANVFIEGKGVARLSDQMTMNKGNTICDGVQNPSVTVAPELDIPSTCEICVRYPNGKRLTNAPYALTDEGITPLGAGALDGSGKSFVSSLMPGKVKLVMQESQDAFCLSPVRRTNPHCIEEISDDDFFDKARKRNQGFWQPTRVETGLAPWGAIGHELTTDRYFQDIVGLETRLHYTHLHPATEFSLEKSCETLVGNLNMPLPHTTEALLAYSMPMILEEGEILSAILRLAPYETTDRLLAFIRARGEGNPQSYLNDYDWAAAKKAVNESFDSLLKKLQSRLEFLRDQASKLKYAYLSDELFNKHINTIKTYGKGLTELIAGVFAKMQLRVSTLMSNTSNVKVIKAADNVYSAEAGVIETVVNTTQTIDLVEPFMNEVAGKIADVLPIYPVRYGYANFFDTIMPAQAPPTLPEMASASGLNETGGYILRLLREGWIYIKEEEGKADNQQIHIFRYAQTETATGVIEKFEKYYFTNEENAQDGLTLDISSGATFYPFAFVTNGTQKISIAYSEHEWAADIIDKMNSDQEWRTQAMQQVDMSASDDFSDTATQDTLSSLVEDYRSHDVKWLADKSKDKPSKYGLDVFTTAKNYYLAADELVETMQKSHSEQKDGTLIALFDPVGRQADIAFALTVMTVWEEKDRSNKRYPREIAKFLNQSFLNEKAHPEVREAALEHLNMEALNAFNKETTELQTAFSEFRAKVVDLYASYAYQELSDGGLGSLDTYLKMYFDVKSDALSHPEVEAMKIAGLTESIFEGVSSSKEGQALLVEMIDAAYENDEDLQNSNNTYYLLIEQLKKTLTQCRVGTEWSEVIQRTPEVFGNLWANARATKIYGKQLAKEFRTKLSAKAINEIADSLLPTFYHKVAGITITGNSVNVTQEKLAEILASHIDSGGKSTLNISIAQKHLTWAKKLTKSVNAKQANYQSKVFRLPEISVELVPLLNGKPKVGPVSDWLGIVGGGATTALSWFVNQHTLYSVLAQSDHQSADPLVRSKLAYDTFNLISALAAITVDSASVGKTALDISARVTKALGSDALAAKVLPKISTGQLRLGTFLAAKLTASLIIGANLAMAVISGLDSRNDWQKGNIGGAIGNAAFSASAVSFGVGAAGSILGISTTGIAICTGIGFALLALGGLITWFYSRSQIENLLASCFWGKDELYSFWYFEKGGSLDIATRINVASTISKRKDIQTAFAIEVQEFANLLLHPSVEVQKEGDFLSPNQNAVYQFKLPAYVDRVSEVFGSIQKLKVDIRQPIQSMGQVELDENATQAFSNALSLALKDPSKHKLEDGMLHLTVEVEQPKDSYLYWYYQPEPSVMVPKRMLTYDGLAKQAFIGMKDDKFL